jgi:hypothetical protein
MSKATARIFTSEALTRVHEMRLAGAKGVEIAKAIGTTSASLRARLSQLGIKRPKCAEQHAAA